MKTPDTRALKAKVRSIHRLLIKEYGLPIRPAWAGTVTSIDSAKPDEGWPPIEPVDELINTILSQNTNDLNRDKAYRSLRSVYSTWEQVRDAPIKKIIEAIRPAGLANQKGPRIQKVLRRITEERGSINIDFLRDLPIDQAKAWLTSFDGVGPKTAAIVLLFAMGKPAFPVDTHIHRVTGRLGLLPPKTSADRAHEILEALVPQAWYYPFHLNVIQHGRTVCKAQRPLCEVCVLQKYCDYYRAVIAPQRAQRSPRN